MYCPRCGQEQPREKVKFCTRCGFSITAVTELITREGEFSTFLKSGQPKSNTPREKGLKQGGILFLSGFLIVPIILVLVVSITGMGDNLVLIPAFITFLGGILRMIYALLFESNEETEKPIQDSIYQTAPTSLNKNRKSESLSAGQPIPTSNYIQPLVGRWRDTNDLNSVSSVVESTTNQLKVD